MHSNAMPSEASGQAEPQGRADANGQGQVNGQARTEGTGVPAEVNGQADGIPEATVARLPVYLRALYGLAERGISTVASEELAAAAGVNSAKLRKDLSHLGSYGIRGVGYDVDYLRHKVAIGVIATPAGSAQAVCDRLVSAGVTSILNFAPLVLSVPEGVDVRKVDLSIELQILAFHAQRRSAARPADAPGGNAGAPGGRSTAQVTPELAAKG